MKRTHSEEAVVDKDIESAPRHHRHLAHAAHVVTSLACAIGSAFIPHFLQHKPFIAPTATPEQLSLRSDSAQLSSDKTLPAKELGTLNNEANSSAQELDQRHDSPSINLAERAGVSPSASLPLPALTRALAANSEPSGAASFAIGNKLSSNAKIFAEAPSVKKKSAPVQSAEISVDKVNRRITIGKTQIKCSTDSKVFLSNAGTICLTYGDTLVDAKNPLLVKVGSDFVLVRKNATALITVRDGSLKVRNLQEQQAYSTELAVNNRPFTICAGEELVAANDFDSLQSTLASDGVSRRQVQTYELSDGTNVMCGEFAPITVIKHNAMLKAMCRSTDATDSKLFSKMMKMAACIAVVTGSHGSYASVRSEPGDQQMAFSDR